jgi:hypothetical protein
LNVALPAYRLIIEKNPVGKNSLTNCDTVGVEWLARLVGSVIAGDPSLAPLITASTSYCSRCVRFPGDSHCPESGVRCSANPSGEGILCSHPQNPGLSAHLSRHSARNSVLLSLPAVRYSFRLHRFPGLSGHRIPRPFGQPAQPSAEPLPRYPGLVAETTNTEPPPLMLLGAAAT